jgi:hypothetical protein
LNLPGGKVLIEDGFEKVESQYYLQEYFIEGGSGSSFKWIHQESQG